MTTYDYYSIPLRFGILIFVLPCLAVAILVSCFGELIGSNLFKCIYATAVFIGFIGLDVIKNHYMEKKRRRDRNIGVAVPLNRIERLRVEN